MDRPQLSIVIACRDAADLLDVQLAALATQDCPVPWELLICDNGSSDGTVELAKGWVDRLPLRIVVADKIPGAGPARNAGVESARGEWIGFCDADDEVGEGWLVALCAALSAHPFVAGRFEGTRLNSARTLRSRALDQQDSLQESSPRVALPNAGGGNLGVHRSAFLEVGGFDPAVRYLQDTDLCWRLQLAGYPLVFVPDLVVHVRLRDTLRGMYRQGRNYGASLAVLERRYGDVAARRRGTQPTSTADPGPESTVTSPSTLAAAPGRTASRSSTASRAATAGRAALGVVRLIKYFVQNRSSIGAQAWQLGWHVGHRS